MKGLEWGVFHGNENGQTIPFSKGLGE